MFSAGSRDVQYANGLLGRIKDNPDLKVDEIVKGYIEQAVKASEEKQLSPAFLIPPPSNLSLRKMPSTDRDLFLKIGDDFTSKLRDELTKGGYPFVDLGAIARDENGRAKADLYIDNSCCLPEAYRLAFTAQ